MSVINEMLKDLDKRKSEQNQSVDGSAVSYIKVNEPDVKLIIIVILITAILCVGFMFLLFDQKDKPRYVDAKKEAIQQIQKTQPIQLQEQQQAAINLNSVEPISVKSESIQPVIENTLLVKAKDEQPTEALNSNTDQVVKSDVVVPKLAEPKIVKSEEVIAKRIETNTVQKEASIPFSAKSEPLSAETQFEVQSETPVKSEPSMVIASVKLTAKELADKKLDQAQRSLKAQRVDEAEALFEEAIMLQPNETEARRQLAALWFGRGANNQAKNLLKQGLLMNHKNEDYRIMLARIYASEGNYSKAFDVLNELPSSTRLEYTLALANMASQSGHHDTAITSYQSLLMTKPNHSQWWLGLAISFDRNEQYSQAVVAYQKSLNSNGLPQTSAKFAKQRLAEIGE